MMTSSGKVGEQQVRDHFADIESYGSIEGKFGINCICCGFRHHEAASVEVTMEQCLLPLTEQGLQRAS